MDDKNSPKNQNPHSGFTVMIEAQALIDYMSFLRGITKDGRVYDDRTSFEFTRFPSFDGSDWDLPESFESFFDNGVKHYRMFDRVRPYDFALREVTYLLQNNIDTIVYVPPELMDYHNEINKWCANYFPGLRTVAGNIADINSTASVWLARTPELANWLIEHEQPFVLLDGKENRNIPNAIRAIRWDQAGYFLRQAHYINQVTANEPGLVDESHVPRFGENEVYLDINSGYQVFPPSVSEADHWVGEQRRLTRLFLSDEFDFTLGDGTRMSDEQIARAKSAFALDLDDLDHKRSILDRYLIEAHNLRLEQPTWARFVERVKNEMQIQLREIEQMTKTNPVTGEIPKRKRNKPSVTSPNSESIKKPQEKTPSKHEDTNPGNRMLMTVKDLNIPSKFQAIELIEAISELASNGAQLRGKAVSKSNITGSLVEDIAASYLQSKGWKILMPRHRTKVPQSGKRSGDVDIKWIGEDGVLERGAVDLIAFDPNGSLHIIEVKAKNSSELSTQQKKLRRHLEKGGRILNPDCLGLRKDQDSFSASYAMVACEQVRHTRRRKQGKAKAAANPQER